MGEENIERDNCENMKKSIGITMNWEEVGQSRNVMKSRKEKH